MSGDGPTVALHLERSFANPSQFRFARTRLKPPKAREGGAVVRVHAAAVNPSDAKAALGQMPHARWPRIPGRDYAGVVIDGPQQWIGRAVYGCGGDLGITRDGTHAAFLHLPAEALRQKPEGMSMAQAASIGVPFVTAYEGLRRAGMRGPGQVVAVMGANGKVGQAAVQLAAHAGGRVIAVQRKPGPFDGFACAPVCTVNDGGVDAASAVLSLTEGRGADIVFNTVGSPYFEATNRCMAKGATQILIATKERTAPFDIFGFFRGMHTYVGIDSIALDCVASNALLEALREGFELMRLKPFPLRRCVALDDAESAYRQVLGGTSERIVLSL